MNRLRREVLVPSVVYCLTCFAVAQLLYMIMLVLDPVAFELSPRRWVASFVFVGTVTAIYCTGGLAGLWLIICSTVARPRDHRKTAILIGAITSSVFFLGFTLAEDHLLLGATFAAGTSVAIAVVVRTYLQSKIT